MLPLKRAVGVIVKNNKIFLIRRIKDGQEYFVFPGGSVEKGETLKEAVAREIKEELGLAIKIKKRLFAIDNKGRKETYFLVADFIGKPKIGGEEKARANTNNQYKPVWFIINKALALPNLYPEKVKSLLANTL